MKLLKKLRLTLALNSMEYANLLFSSMGNTRIWKNMRFFEMILISWCHMLRVEKKFSILLLASLVFWFIFVFAFYQTKQKIVYLKIETFFPLVEFLFDLLIIYISWVIYKKIDLNFRKYILFLFV